MSNNIPEFSVTEFSKSIKKLIEESYSYVKIRGEITGFKKASSGHLYFSLKEDESIISAVYFKKQIKDINFEIGDGLEILAYGKITTYQGRSNYQIIIDKIEIAGIGAFLEMIEKRKQKLEKEGFFDPKYKLPIPFFPKQIAVITSITGSVIEDIKHRIFERCPTHLVIFPVAVQGINAASEIIKAIKYFNNLNKNRPDVIIIARGGGSFEDLLPFSEENLIKEVFKCNIPIISAVGHETDTTLIDYVADLRAPTPSAAAEIATPIFKDLFNNYQKLTDKLENNLLQQFNKKVTNLTNLYKYLINPTSKIDKLFEKINKFNNQLKSNVNFVIKNKHQKILKLEKPQFYLGKLNIKIDFLSQKMKSDINSYFNFKLREFTKIKLPEYKLKSIITNEQNRIVNLQKNLHRIINNDLVEKNNKILNFHKDLDKITKGNIVEKFNKFSYLSKNLDNLNHKNILKRGFSIVRHKNKIINSNDKIANNDLIEIEFFEGTTHSIVIDKNQRKMKKNEEKDNIQQILL